MQRSSIPRHPTRHPFAVVTHCSKALDMPPSRCGLCAGIGEHVEHPRRIVQVPQDREHSLLEPYVKATLL